MSTHQTLNPLILAATDGSSDVHRTLLVPISVNTVLVGGLQALKNLPVCCPGLRPVAGAPAGTRVGGSVPHSINTGTCLCKLIFNPLPT